MNLYLKRFPERPLEQKPTEPIPNINVEKRPITSIHGVCWVGERSVRLGLVTKEQLQRRIAESMIDEISKQINPILLLKEDEYGTLRATGAIDILTKRKAANQNDDLIFKDELKFGGF